MIPKRLIVVGAGKLGAFHLQGLAKIDDTVIIDVYDPQPKALGKAKTFCDQISSAKKHQISYIDDAKKLKKDYDFGINATTSGVRAESVIETGHLAEHWILEKILSQNLQQMDQIETHFGRHQKIWVNHVLREMEWLKKAHNDMKNDSFTSFETVGKDWSLACNLTHYLDLVNWLSGKKLIALNTDRLNTNWLKSKRSGHFDILGKVVAVFEDGVKATFTSEANGENRISKIITKFDEWHIDEISATVFSKSGHRYSGEFTRQSTLTTLFANDVLSGRDLNLPTLDCAKNTHRIFITAMLDHWNKSTNRQDTAIPIT